MKLTLGFLCYISGIIQVDSKFYIGHHLVKSNEGASNERIFCLGDIWNFSFLLQHIGREMQFQKVLDIVYFYWGCCMTFPSCRKQEQENTVGARTRGSQFAEITWSVPDRYH